jgi:hypothetical protein
MYGGDGQTVGEHGQARRVLWISVSPSDESDQGLYVALLYSFADVVNGL